MPNLFRICEASRHGILGYFELYLHIDRKDIQLAQDFDDNDSYLLDTHEVEYINNPQLAKRLEPKERFFERN